MRKRERKKKREQKGKRREGEEGGCEIEGIGRKRSGEGGVDVQRGGEKEEGGREGGSLSAPRRAGKK